MAFLDTLNVAIPADTDPVSEGALRIRETRSATESSFGLEHYLHGEHHIKAGTIADRPSPGSGQDGKWYVNFDRGGIEQTILNQWIKLRVVQMAYAYSATSIPLGLSSYTSIASVAINTSLLAQLYAFGQFILQIPNAGLTQSTTIEYRLVVDGAELVPGPMPYVWTTADTSNGLIPLMTLSTFGILAGLGLAEGAHTLEMQVKTDFSLNGLACKNRLVGALIL